MKKIFLSLLVTGVVGGSLFAATNAFFSDVETSTGNSFVAGKVDLKIDSTAHYAGMICTGGVWVDEDQVPSNNPRPELLGDPCTGTWTLADLTQERFFDFTDVKPGDEGEVTISMHIDDNPVWACIDITNMQNLENGIVEPESSAGDVTTPAGELAQNLHFTAWLDQGATPGFNGDDLGEGDNVWQGDETEPLLFSNESGPASDVLNGKTYTLAASDVLPGLPLPGGETMYLGLQWCAGSMDVDTSTNSIDCNGATMGNEAQTDSLTADIAFRVEQHRNNPNFTCVLPTPTPTTPAE